MVLYAHTRAVSIITFRFFTILDKFKRYYVNLYWSYKVVEPNQFEPSQEVVGHPSGHKIFGLWWRVNM